MKSKFQLKLLPALLGVGFAGGALASGFQLQNQNGSGTGLAYAGAAAVAEDASTIFFNPAGMTYLPEGKNISVGGTVLDRSVKFTNTGTTPMPVINPSTLLPTGSLFAVGSNGGDGGGSSFIPAFFFSQSLSPDLTFGLGVTPTFGSETEYDETFAGRFSGYYSSIKQTNINPSLAYKVNPALSIGVGLNFAKNETEFRQLAPYGSSGVPVVIKGDDTAWGYNFGVMLQPSEQTRLGLSYRSTVDFELDGTFNLVGVSSTPITAKLETPDSFSVAFSHMLNTRLELLADATWTGWSSIKSIDLVGVNRSLSYNFDDTWRVGVGAKYQWDDQWNLRFGVAFDQTPVQTAADRTMTLPDSDRTWLAFGARYAVSKQTSVDFGYAHIFFDDAPTARQVLSGSTLLQTIKGDFDTSADLLSIQLNHKF